jgi:hypothetical protein
MVGNPIEPPLSDVNLRLTPTINVQTNEGFNERIYITGSMPKTTPLATKTI